MSNCVVLLHNREFLNVYDAVLAALVCCAHGSLKLRNHRLCPLRPRFLRERRQGFHNTVLCYHIAISFFLEAAQPANHWAKGYVRYVRRSKPSGAIRQRPILDTVLFWYTSVMWSVLDFDGSNPGTHPLPVTPHSSLITHPAGFGGRRLRNNQRNKVQLRQSEGIVRNEKKCIWMMIYMIYKE